MQCGRCQTCAEERIHLRISQRLFSKIKIALLHWCNLQLLNTQYFTFGFESVFKVITVNAKSFPASVSPQVSPCLSVLSWLLFVNDTDILADACWALSYLSDGPNDKIQAVIDSGVCRRLVELLM